MKTLLLTFAIAVSTLIPSLSRATGHIEIQTSYIGADPPGCFHIHVVVNWVENGQVNYLTSGVVQVGDCGNSICDIQVLTTYEKADTPLETVFFRADVQAQFLQFVQQRLNISANCSVLVRTYEIGVVPDSGKISVSKSNQSGLTLVITNYSGVNELSVNLGDEIFGVIDISSLSSGNYIASILNGASGEVIYTKPILR
jgi:hypothetical protein